MFCHNTAVIPAPVDRVWALLREFHDLSWCSNVLSKLDVLGDKKADEVGARRLLNDAFHETLLGLNDSERSMEYSIDDGPDVMSKELVKGYVGTVRAIPVTDSGHTFVEFRSTWKGGGDGVKDFCDPIYRGILGELKKHFS